MSISAEQRRNIRELAGDCCEYCRVAEDDRLARFQNDHIIPIKHGGADDTDNLCLACLKCNSFKGPNVAALDPQSGEATNYSTLASKFGMNISRSTRMLHSQVSLPKDVQQSLCFALMKPVA